MVVGQGSSLKPPVRSLVCIASLPLIQCSGIGHILSSTVPVVDPVHCILLW